MLEGKVRESYEEEMEGEICNVMKILFTEDEMFARVQQQNPQSTGSIHPDLPMVLYNNLDKIVVNLVKAI